MNQKVTLLSLLEILSSLSCGILILFVTYRLLQIYGKKKLGLTDNNQAFQFFIASVLFSIGFILSGVIQPILNYYRIVSNSDISSFQLILSFIGTGAIYITISYLLSVVITIVGIGVYMFMTPLDEIKEIKNNNVGVAVVLGAIVIVLALMCKDGIILLIESIVPYPNLPPH